MSPLYTEYAISLYIPLCHGLKSHKCVTISLHINLYKTCGNVRKSVTTCRSRVTHLFLKIKQVTKRNLYQLLVVSGALSHKNLRTLSIIKIVP